MSSNINPILEVWLDYGMRTSHKKRNPQQMTQQCCCQIYTHLSKNNNIPDTWNLSRRSDCTSQRCSSATTSHSREVAAMRVPAEAGSSGHASLPLFSLVRSRNHRHQLSPRRCGGWRRPREKCGRRSRVLFPWKMRQEIAETKAACRS